MSKSSFFFFSPIMIKIIKKFEFKIKINHSFLIQNIKNNKIKNKNKNKKKCWNWSLSNHNFKYFFFSFCFFKSIKWMNQLFIFIVAWSNHLCMIQIISFNADESHREKLLTSVVTDKMIFCPFNNQTNRWTCPLWFMIIEWCC